MPCVQLLKAYLLFIGRAESVRLPNLLYYGYYKYMALRWVNVMILDRSFHFTKKCLATKSTITTKTILNTFFAIADIYNYPIFYLKCETP